MSLSILSGLIVNSSRDELIIDFNEGNDQQRIEEDL